MSEIATRVLEADNGAAVCRNIPALLLDAGRFEVLEAISDWIEHALETPSNACRRRRS